MLHMPVKWEARGNRIYEGNEEIAVATKASPSLRKFADQTAQFIAAAPEMYDALCDMVSDHEALNPATIDFARRALRKARGEA